MCHVRDERLLQTEFIFCCPTFFFSGVASKRRLQYRKPPLGVAVQLQVVSNSTRRTKKSQVHDKEGTKEEIFFIEDSGSSDWEDDFNYGSQKRHKDSSKQSVQLRESSLLLTFPISSGNTQQNISSVSSDDLQEEDSNQSIEDWMILGGEEQEDSNILLNLHWSSSEHEFGAKDMSDEISVPDIWAVSDKDKYSAEESLDFCYFIPGRSFICYVCNKAGHFAKHCTSQKKSPTCILCGIRGHIQRDCPGRPCPHCGLPSHGLDPCRVPPVWKQHCQRCGAMGHLTDACPDTWRQYHLTVSLEVPFKPRTVCSFKPKSDHAHCYNCSKRGHYGYECTRSRMISGTFPSLPYVCHYDTVEDFLQRGTRMHTGTKDLLSAGSCPANTEDYGEKNGRSRKKEASGRRKTWPERCRERREMKRLRREAKVRREGGGLLRRSRCNSDEVCPADPFRNRRFISPPEKKKEEKDGEENSKA